jgi:hypothetical protein
MSKNLVLITCAVAVQENSVFSTEQRFQQILHTILSAHKYIPNAYIVLLETGSVTVEQQVYLRGFVSEVHTYNIQHLKKNQGEAHMLYHYLISPDFLAKMDQFTHIHKLSGRYFLTERFSYSTYDLSKPLIKYRPDERGGVYETRYYRFPISFFPSFIERFHQFMTTRIQELEYDDVEHIFFRERFLDPEQSIVDQPIGVGGWYSGSGKYIED